MTLETILELARQARRSPHARRVLHDALLERYGDNYLRILSDAQRSAELFDTPVLVLLRAKGLSDAEHAWRFYMRAPSTLPLSYDLLQEAFAFDDASARPRHRYFAPRDGQYLLTVLPPNRSRSLTEGVTR